MSRLARVAGLLPLVWAVATAMALTGAAVYTVAQAGCPDPGRYVQRNGVVELVGGCTDHADLPGVPRHVDPTPTDEPQAQRTPQQIRP